MSDNFRGTPSEADKATARVFARYLKLKGECNLSDGEILMAAAAQAALVLMPEEVHSAAWSLLQSIDETEVRAADLEAGVILKKSRDPNMLCADIMEAAANQEKFLVRSSPESVSSIEEAE